MNFSYEFELSGILWGYSRGEHVMDSHDEHTLYAIELETGEILVSEDFKGAMGGYGTPWPIEIIEDVDTSYILLNTDIVERGENSLILFDASTGEQLAEHPVPNYSWVITDQEGRKSVLSFGEESMVRSDLISGEVIWEYNAPEGTEYHGLLIEEPYLVLSLKGLLNEEILIVFLDYATGDNAFSTFKTQGVPRFIVEDSVITLKDRLLQRIAPPQIQP